MAQRLPKQLSAGAQLTTSAATYYTVPANTITTIAAMTLTNTTGTARTVTVYLVPSGGTAGDDNCILYQRVVPAGKSYNVAEAIGQTIPAGATIQALADANTAITIVASGYETNT